MASNAARSTLRQRIRSKITLLSLGRGAIYAAQAICAGHLFFDVGYAKGYCTGASMFPTFEPEGDVLLYRCLRRSNPTAALAHGDIVVALSPRRYKDVVCKRILGFEGDIVWADPTGEADIRPPEWVRVPAGHVWLVGDNPANSRDSRNYGPVSVNLLRGKVVARISPWRTFGRVRNEVVEQHIEF